MPEQPLKLNEELVNKAKESSLDENKDNQIEAQELEPKTILNLLCKYVNENGITADSALKEISPPKKPWWGYPGKIKEGKEFKIDDGNIQLNIGELVFRPHWSKARKEFSLAKEQHIIVIDLETSQDDDEKLQKIRIKYFYYLCKKLREQTNNWNISVQDEPSTHAKGRRMLKIFFGYSNIKGTSDKDFQKWIELFDEVYNFLYRNRPTKDELNTIPTPDYTRGWKVCGPLEDFCKKTYNDNMNADTEKTDKIEARNRIIFGAPGTGKSHQANLDANELLLGKPKKENKLDDADKKIKAAHMERVTFHPEYSYFDFVGSYKPVMRNVPAIYVEGGISKTAKTEQGEKATERKIEYAFVPGPFTRILVKALKDKGHPYLLLIEEINRARVAAVFGDVFQLLDRSKEGESEYSICLSEDLKEHLKEQGLPLNELKLPPNLYIWATMNSADQGVYPLDTAFKRRWSMEYLSINEGAQNDCIGWNTIRKGINDLLKPHVNEDKLMGYHFLKEEERDTKEHLEEALAGKVLMYLFDDAAKPCRKAVFKEINKARIYSDLREKMSLSESNLGIFTGSEFWPGQQEQRAGGNEQNETNTEEAEPDVEQQ